MAVGARSSQGPDVKQGVASALARYTLPGECPFAVVFDLHGWIPVQPPPGSAWDYETFPSLERAAERAQGLPPEAEAAIWQYGEHGWSEREAVA